MKATFIKEITKIESKNPVLIKGLPEMGMVGRIATCYFIKQLGAKKFAHKCVPKFLFLSVIRPSRAFHNVSCGLCHLHCP